MTLFDDHTDVIFDDPNFGVDATYTPDGGAPVVVRCIFTKDVELASAGFSEVSDRRTIVAVRNSEVSAPIRGDTFLIGAITYAVDVIIDDDGFVTVSAVNPVLGPLGIALIDTASSAYLVDTDSGAYLVDT